MKRDSLKLLTLLVALLFISSCFGSIRGVEASDGSTEKDKPVQCVRPVDCVPLCRGCTVNQCTAGLCVCGCTGEDRDGSVQEVKPVQCVRPNDCIARCRGCTVNKCTAGLCVCGC